MKKMIYCLIVVFLTVIIGCGSENPLENASLNNSEISFSIEKVLSYRYTDYHYYEPYEAISVWIFFKVKNVSNEPITFDHDSFGLVDKKGALIYNKVSGSLFDSGKFTPPKNASELGDCPGLDSIILKPGEQISIGFRSDYGSANMPKGEWYLVFYGIHNYKDVSYIPIQKMIDGNIKDLVPPRILESECQPPNAAWVKPDELNEIRIVFTEKMREVKLDSFEPKNAKIYFVFDGNQTVVISFLDGYWLPQDTDVIVMLSGEDMAGNSLKNARYFISIR